MPGSGPLAGLRVVEMAGVGPGPMCAMLLADLGATVLRIDRPAPVDLGLKRPLRQNFVLRGRKAIALDLKDAAARDVVLELVARADALIEGFRPGVMERLGLGPTECLARNPALVFGRVTGWGQDGPLAQAAGHDLNYVALSGALHAIGRAGQPPAPPLNLVGDYAGGSLYLAVGLLAAVLEARRGGRGQVVDAAIVDGVAHLMTGHYGLLAAGLVNDARGENLLDGGAPWYDSYVCADGHYVSIAPIEARFFAELLRRIGLDPAELPAQQDRARWPELRARLAAVFLTRTREEWCRLLEGSDACFAPVLSPREARDHPHLRARGVFVTVDGEAQPAPAPRFGAHAPVVPSPPEAASRDGASAALEGWLAPERVAGLVADGILR
jgi:crotonobetainyl-CoA:carnitine CoA-transferase CaiB-like acyl-CoA transferase